MRLACRPDRPSEDNNEDQTMKEYRVVGIDEADLSRGCISWTSPLARSLLSGKAGDVIKVSTPAGEQELEIIEVRYLDFTKSNL